MFGTIKQVYDLIGSERPGRWVLLLLLTLCVSALEMIGAVLVYALLALVADPGSSVSIPLLGDLRAILGGDDRSVLLTIVAAMAGFFLLRAGVKIGVAYVKARIINNAAARLSQTLVQGYLRWPYATHLHRNSSELIRNGHQAVLELVGQVLSPGLKVLADSVLVVGLLVVLLVINPLATLAAMVVVGGAGAVLLLLVQPKLKDLGQIRHIESKRSLFVLQESLQGIRDIKLLGRERTFSNSYGRSRQKMARATYLQATLEQVPQVLIETALLGFILGFFVVAVTGDVDQATILSTLGLFAYAGLRMQPAIQGIVIGLNKLKFAAAPVEDIYRDFDAAQQEGGHTGVSTPMPFRKALQLNQVRFRYDGADVDAVRPLDISIEPGQQIGICGPTGGGKTTLVDLVIGLLDPTEGRVTVDDLDVREHRRAWQANLGVVPQTIFLTDDTLRRNIAFGVPDDRIDDEAVADAVRLAQLDDFVARLPEGLETRVGERGVRISGGQRQRLAIARALYRRPTVLVFDEGTSALDNTTEAMLMEAIESLREDHTVILIAHRLSTVRKSDVVLLLEHGELTGVGTYDELEATNERFRALAALG